MCEGESECGSVHFVTYCCSCCTTLQVLLDVLLQLVSVHLSQGDVAAAGAQVGQLMLCLPEESSCLKDSPSRKAAVDTRGTQAEGNGEPLYILCGEGEAGWERKIQ